MLIHRCFDSFAAAIWEVYDINERQRRRQTEHFPMTSCRNEADNFLFQDNGIFFLKFVRHFVASKGRGIEILHRTRWVLLSSVFSPYTFIVLLRSIYSNGLTSNYKL